MAINSAKSLANFLSFVAIEIAEQAVDVERSKMEYHSADKLYALSDELDHIVEYLYENESEIDGWIRDHT